MEDIWIDITGNWQDAQGICAHLRVREPEPDAGNSVVFSQSLLLPPGTYSMILEYNRLLDKRPGQAIDSKYDGFNGLFVNGQQQMLAFHSIQEKETTFRAQLEFTVTDGAITTPFTMSLFNTRPLRTLLGSAASLPSGGHFEGVRPDSGGELMLIRGIPFIIRKFVSYHNPPGMLQKKAAMQNLSLKEWHENGITLPCNGAKVKTMHLLGMTHSSDIANGSWYSKKGDHGYSHFAGDRAGEVVLRMTNGSDCTIPLIFGYNIWYCTPWDMVWHYGDNPYMPGSPSTNFDAVMFCGESGYREGLQRNIGLTDAIRHMGANSTNVRYLFSVDLDGRSVDSIRITADSALHGFPVISAVTLETYEPTNGLIGLPDISSKTPSVLLQRLESIENHDYMKGISEIKRILYTHADELPLLVEPEKPEGYFGPSYHFTGNQTAVYAATYLYYNGPECAAYIADTGTECSSSTAKWALHHYTQGMGVWIERKPLYDGLTEFFALYRQRSPGQLPGRSNAWTRGVGELVRESMAFGYDKFINSYLDWLDECLFTEANPPHWNRVAGEVNQDYASYYRTIVGDIEERGNRENDGHGICMWGRYMAWHWLGRSKAWNARRWMATKAAVDWIQWQLDTDTIRPGKRQDVLYTESECAHGSYDFYSSFNCLHGIKLSIRLAEQLSHTDEVKSWTVLYERLAQGILDHLTDESEYGLIWHTEPITDWQDHAHKLAHLHLATDGDTYTPLEDYSITAGFDSKYLEIDKNSYRYLMKEKNYNCLRMYGYGQGMMTQAALLLDEMLDAEQFTDMLLKHCYLPKFGRWLSPEGIILHRSGEFYLPVNGYMGQDSHVADSTKAIRLMLGIDDNDPEHLRLVPRFPQAWDNVQISEYLVLTGDFRQKLAYTYSKLPDGQRFQFSFERPVASLSVRLGPVPPDKRVVSASFNGANVPFEPLESGDSRWVWVCGISGTSGDVHLLFEQL